MHNRRPFAWPGSLLAAAILLAVAAGLRAAPAPEVRLDQNVIYGHAGGVDLLLDLARPAEGDGPFPLVVCIHGGGWAGGNKSAYRGLIQELAKRGYVAATISYRLTPAHRFPAQIEDVKCAVRYLRSRAAELKIDPKRVASLGGSAGGHLALMVGLMDPADGLEGDSGHPEQPSKVQAVVNYFGPTEFRAWNKWITTDPTVKPELAKWLQGLLTDLIGTTERDTPAMDRVSPVTYINRGDPPVLTLHGTQDPLVTVGQARLLDAALRKVGVPSTLEIVEGAGHGWGGKDAERTNRIVFEFLDKQLKGEKR